MNNNVKIYIACHKPGPMIHSECLIPIQGGRAIAEHALDGIIGDNSGENISAKNASWCELTILYWMWKNVDADYYGLFHYRRLLDFKSENPGYHQFMSFSPEVKKRFGWQDSHIRKLCAQYDVITAPIWNVHPVGLPENTMTVYDFYAKEHYSKDLDIVIELIKERSPEIYPYALRALYSKQSFFFNIAIMKKVWFQDYCRWLFDILFEAEKRIDIEKYNPYQKRIWGFIGERMINCYLTYLKATQEELKHKELGVAFGILDYQPVVRQEVLETLECRKDEARQLKTADTVEVVFAIDDNYVVHCATAIKSLTDYLNTEQALNIYILHDCHFSQQSKLLLQSLAYGAVHILFVQIDTRQVKMYPLNREHISMATYYRLMLHEVLPESVTKVIYLDCDVVVTDSIVKLWQEDLADNYLAGVCDEGNLVQSRRLGLPYSHQYINAGVSVFNLQAIRKINATACYLETFYRHQYDITLQDQDIINIAFCNKIKTLPLVWNVQSRMYLPNELEHSFSAQEAFAAACSPSIIHYSDRYKPWNANCQHPLKILYENYHNMLGEDFKSIEAKKNFMDFISYQSVGNKVEVFIHFGRKKKKIILPKKVARFGYRLIRKVF